MSCQSLLDRVDALVQAVTKTNASNEKIEIVKKFNDLAPFIKLLMHPLHTTGVTRAKIEEYETRKKRKRGDGAEYTDDITVLLERLYAREYSGHAAYEAVLFAIDAYPQHRELVLNIAEKNLKLRMDVTQINKAFPNLVPVFKVALAQDMNKAQKQFDASIARGEAWLMSRKFDGVRVLVIHDGKTVASYSRNGNALPAMQGLNDMVASFAGGTSPFVLDGEVCAVDADGNEDFSAAVSQVKRKSVVMKEFRYFIFDRLTLDEFESGEGKRSLSQRLRDARDNIAYLCTLPSFQLVEQIPYTPEALAALSDTASARGWEGVMLRRDTDYKGKRSNDILKCKQFSTEEYVVTGTECAVQRVIDKETGLEKEENLLRAVTIDHKGHVVHVGSGFSQDQRRHYRDHPDDIVGRTISVQFFEECSNAQGGISLRFPTVKTIWDAKRDV